jgi:hypothetical protein
MTQDNVVDDVARVLAESAQTDLIGLWVVSRFVLDAAPELTMAEAMTATLASIRTCLMAGTVVAGEFVVRDEDTLDFVAWPSAVDDTMVRIERAWRALGREPNLGDIVWFVDPQLLPVTSQRHPMGKGWKPGA